jgi:hypothetical protein
MKAIRLVAAFFIASLTVQTLWAQDKPAPAWPGPCKDDVEKLCADKRSKSLCLIDHESELSPGCATMVQGWSKKGAESKSSWLGSCSGDAERLCPGQKSISLCLIDHEDKLSPDCGKLVASWDKKQGQSPKAWMGACSSDAQRLCAGKQSINLCMMEHKDQWSPACRRSIDANQKKKPAPPPAPSSSYPTFGAAWSVKIGAK